MQQWFFFPFLWNIQQTRLTNFCKFDAAGSPSRESSWPLEIEIEIMPTAYFSDAARSWSRTRTPKVRQMHPGQRFEIQISVAASKSPVCLVSEYIRIASCLFFFFCCFRRCFFWSNFWLVRLSVLNVKMSQENFLHCRIFSIRHFVIYFEIVRSCCKIIFYPFSV